VNHQKASTFSKLEEKVQFSAVQCFEISEMQWSFSEKKFSGSAVQCFEISEMQWSFFREK
jgi:hypothetical protein